MKRQKQFERFLIEVALGSRAKRKSNRMDLEERSVLQCPKQFKIRHLKMTLQTHNILPLSEMVHNVDNSLIPWGTRRATRWATWLLHQLHRLIEALLLLQLQISFGMIERRFHCKTVFIILPNDGVVHVKSEETKAATLCDLAIVMYTASKWFSPDHYWADQLGGSLPDYYGA